MPSTPPALLISVTASLTPSRMDTPMEADPPVNGPLRPILIDCAWATDTNMVVAARAERSFFMVHTNLIAAPVSPGRGFAGELVVS